MVDSSPGGVDRAVTPAVGKTLELGLVVLFVGLLTTVLLGSVVPGYRTNAAERLGERALATAADEVQASIPPVSRDVDATTEVTLPSTLRGSTYTIAVDGQSLVLEHEHPRIGGRARLALPDRVTRVEGRWHSGGRTVVHVSESGDGLVVELATEEGS